MAAVKNSDQLATPFFRRRIVVIGVSVCVMLAVAGGVWLLWRALPEVPVHEVVFVNASSIEDTAAMPAAPFVHLKTEDLHRVAEAVASAKLNALRVDLSGVKAAVEQLEWVRRADVRRRLPDKIEVRIEEHVPFGIWRGVDHVKRSAAPVVAGADADANVNANVIATVNANTKPMADETDADDEVAVNGMLINNFGEVFKAGLSNAEFATLPILGGPQSASKDVIVAFDQFRRQLISIERAPRELQLSVRRAWTVKLDNGVTLELGRNDAEQRLQRFIQAHSQIAELKAANIHVDLRYASGLALRNMSRAANMKAVSAPEKRVSLKNAAAKSKVLAKPVTKKKARKVKAI